jgi:hypothetical protein
MQGVWGFVSGGGYGREGEVAEGQLFYLGEVGTPEEEGFVAGVEFNASDVSGLGKGAGGDFVSFRLIVLLYGEVDVTWR